MAASVIKQRTIEKFIMSEFVQGNLNTKEQVSCMLILIQKKLGADTTKKHAEEALAAVLESIKEGVKESGKVQIIGFGTFATKTREARTGRNPKTGNTINIPASKTVAFKASSALKD